MASLRSLVLLVWIFSQAILVLSQEDNCASMFDSNKAEVSGYDAVVNIEIFVDELTLEEEIIYDLTWKECVDPPIIIDDEFNKYFTVNDTTDCTWEISTSSKLIYLPDYPSPQESVTTKVIFEDFTNITYETCQVILIHIIKDANTKCPEPDKMNYSVDIKEDFMPGYIISNFKTSVHDKDGTSPNNQFTVTIDDDCPLEATKNSYPSGSSAADVKYKLRKSLDYEITKQIECQVTFQDKGTPPLSKTVSISVNVKDEPDEPPQFTKNYYYSEVLTTTVINEPLTVMPSKIEAVDGDTDINSPITYSMTNVQMDVDGEAYFSINSDTGEVTQTQALDHAFFLNEQVMFFVKAEESDGTHTSAVLRVRLPWHYLVCGGMHFEQAQYVVEIPHQSVGQVLQVVAVVSNNVELEYSLSEDRVDKQHFDIDPSSGWIKVNKDNKPTAGLYELSAIATVKEVPSEQANAKVNIHVTPLSSETLVIATSVIRYTAQEGTDEEEVGTFTISQLDAHVCIIGAQPTTMHEKFSLEKKSDLTWRLMKKGELDYDSGIHEITLVIEAFEADVSCPDVTGEIPSYLIRSRAMAIISVSNQNDVSPVFSSGDLVVAYPINEGLRRAVGPVVSVQAKDNDSMVVKYSVTGPDAAQFTVDEITGEVYVVKGLECDPQCNLSVKASDGDNDAQLNVKILPLDMEHVFTLPMSDTSVSEVDDALTQLSKEVDAQVSKLYVSLTEPTTMTRGRRHKRESPMSLEVHVYSIKGGSLMSLDEFNSALGEDSPDIEAEEFLDAVVFAKDTGGDDNTLGLTVGVAVLGSLLGIILIAGIGFFVYKKKKGSAPKQQRPPSPIRTLGNAYQNQSYEKDSHVMQGSLSHKTNGSLNGFTSVQIHSTQSGDSPPMHRSSLASPSDIIPLRSMDNQQQQGGLRRISPSAPEYYGSSTPVPPPSFTRTTTSHAIPEASSSSSSYPIYAEIKKPKDAKPKSTAFASASSTSRSEKNVPRSDLPARSIDKKAAVPSTDYEEVGKTKFASLKNSPPPRRSNHHNDDDDDDEDVNEGVAYPGGKTDKYADESSLDEKKSVAFKVMVDTKEIEAENMGPAQRKAEAEKKMEANRKKLQDEGNEEDENDEESAKL